MRREAPRPAALGRRTFLRLASGAVGAWAAPAWAAPAGERGVAGAGPEGEHSLTLRVPGATSNGAKVPIVVESGHPMNADHHVTQVRVRNDGDPVASKGTFHFSPANGRVYLAFQARMHEGASTVAAVAECSVHGAFAASSPIEIPAGAGGCAGGAAKLGRAPGDEVRGPVIRIPELVERGSVRAGELVRVQVKMRHPNRTGLVLREGRFVQESDPVHLDALEAFWDGERVSWFALTSALSDDPLITFTLLARRGRLEVVFTNSRGERFRASHDLEVAA